MPVLKNCQFKHVQESSQIRYCADLWGLLFQQVRVGHTGVSLQLVRNVHKINQSYCKLLDLVYDGGCLNNSPWSSVIAFQSSAAVSIIQQITRLSCSLKNSLATCMFDGFNWRENWLTDLPVVDWLMRMSLPDQ